METFYSQGRAPEIINFIPPTVENLDHRINLYNDPNITNSSITNMTFLNDMVDEIRLLGWNRDLTFVNCRFGRENLFGEEPLRRPINFVNCIFIDCRFEWTHSYGACAKFLNCVIIRPKDLNKTLPFNYRTKIEEYKYSDVFDETTEDFLERFEGSSVYLLS